ncbi:MAG TPA: DNA polymerase III subunit chi [Burkholderiales bacterium]
MTRVDFYLLREGEPNGKPLAACRLAHKAYRLKHRVYILARDAQEAVSLDRLLWTFNPGSFVPHRIHGEPFDPIVPVLIGHDAPPEQFNDVLISLAPAIPPFFDRFARVAELVGPDEAERAQARERFRAYRDRGFMVQTHNL